MQVKQIPVGSFEMNCYVVSTDATNECIIIDPGDEPRRIINYIEENNLVPEKIILTHGHIDHARRVSEVQKYFKIPLFLGEGDIPLLESLNEQAAMFGMDKTELPEITGFLDEHDGFDFGGIQVKFMHTPGHSPGSFCVQMGEHLFVGDVLFFDSIGRTDLYGGSYPVLIESIRNKLLTLPDETQVYPGHGPTTTIGRERLQNPFLNP